MKGKCLMMQGTASSVGKSILTAAVCRILKQDGYRVAPFKAQNMALNSFITKAGLEMGRAQVVQAEASGVDPTVEMNPILLKPTSDRKSQVIINGRVHGNMTAMEYHQFKPELREMIKKTYDSLESKFDFIILEGAGSPAEINLREGDVVNMSMADSADAPVLLIGDIDRGGVFASLAGTMMLLTAEERARVKGVIINKFRGDVKILEPGLKMLEDIIHVPVVGVVPWMDVDIEDEDSVTDRFKRTVGQGKDIEIAIVKIPHMSNFTDYQIFSLERSVHTRYVDRVEDLEQADIIILPGSKNTIEDLLYLKNTGMDQGICRHGRAGKPIIGICGGYQMLAVSLHDPHHTESHIEKIAGLGLLDMEVTYRQEKVTTQAKGKVIINGPGILSGLEGTELEGYEIHMGDNTFGSDIVPCISLTERNDTPVEEIDGICNQNGNVFGSYIHGLFDNGSFLRGIINNVRRQKGLVEIKEQVLTLKEFKEREYDRLAEIVRANLNMELLYQILRGEV